MISIARSNAESVAETDAETRGLGDAEKLDQRVSASACPRVPPSLTAFVLYFLKLGATGFGGPIALAAAMRQTLVEERGWISDRDYGDGLALAQLAPGPLAAQLAMYLGYVRAGVLGATLVSVAFILPSFLIVWALSVAYVRFGGLGWMQAVFYGLGAAVIGVIARSAWKLAHTTLGRRAHLWIIFGILAITTALLEREPASLIVVSGLVSLLLAIGRGSPVTSHRDQGPATCDPGLVVFTVASPALLGQLTWFFAKAGMFVFGSGLAIVPFLYGGVVQEYGWLNEQQFLDAVAVAMITPGPVVITVSFIGYLIAREPGMTLAAVGVFLPVYLFVVLPAPYFRRYRNNVYLQAFVAGVTAAATGAIAGAVVVLARRALVDFWTVSIAAITLVILLRWRISELWLIGAAAIAGLILRA